MLFWNVLEGLHELLRKGLVIRRGEEPKLLLLCSDGLYYAFVVRGSWFSCLILCFCSRQLFIFGLGLQLNSGKLEELLT